LARQGQQGWREDHGGLVLKLGIDAMINQFCHVPNLPFGGEYEETYQKQELIVGFTVVFVLGSCLQLCTKDCKTAYMCEQSTENA
jgi:hypothetical protein